VEDNIIMLLNHIRKSKWVFPLLRRGLGWGFPSPSEKVAEGRMRLRWACPPKL
jgi:hypothetical protein